MEALGSSLEIKSKSGSCTTLAATRPVLDEPATDTPASCDPLYGSRFPTRRDSTCDGGSAATRTWRREQAYGLSGCPLDSYRRTVPDERPHVYVVEYGRDGWPIKSKRVDLGHVVTVGETVEFDGKAWKVRAVDSPMPGATHLGHVRAIPAD